MFDKLLEFIFPKRCIICGKILELNTIEKQEFACNNCKKKLEYISREMSVRKVVNKYYDYFYFSYKYEGTIRDLLLNYKFSNKRFLYDFLSYKISNELKLFTLEKIDLIIYVPISYKRFLERGFNQSFLIAKRVSKSLNVPLFRFILIKTKHNQTQSLLSKKERIINTQNVYKVLFKDFIKSKNILLVDDIYTTGATCNECAKVLKKAGANRIIVATVAKA